MKKLFETLSSLVRRLTLLYSILVTIMAVVSICITKYTSPAVMSEFIMYSLLFSFLTSLFTTLCEFIKNNAVIKNALKFLLIYASFALCFFAGAGIEGNNKLYTISMLSMGFVIVYAVCGIVKLAASSIAKKVKNNSAEYVSVFDK
jgi:hypothetical protein